MRTRTIATAGIVAAIVGWWLTRASGEQTDPGDTGDHAEHAPEVSHRGSAGSAREDLARAASRARMPDLTALAVHGVAIAGTVRDRATLSPVAHVEVVLRGAAGDESTTTGDDGGFAFEVAPGEYRAFVHDDVVVTPGVTPRVRLPAPPSAEAAGVPDERALPVIVARADVRGLELAVDRTAVLAGTVVDRDGAPIAHAVIRAHGTRGEHAATGTDVAESGIDGEFELRVPSGQYLLEASHPRFAGTAERQLVALVPGARDHVDVVLARGCIVTGRVVRGDGSPAPEGAIEQRVDDRSEAFGPAARIEPGGTFRFATTRGDDVTLRAWPWKSTHSDPRSFACSDGARFRDVVFRVPDEAPSLEGTLVSSDGTPVPFGYLNIAPLDPGGMGQQERADASGHWQVFAMPAGRYQIDASVPGDGLATAEVTAPSAGTRLVLSGTGRIEGTTPGLTTGMLEVRFVRCVDHMLEPESRLVTVTDGRFALDGMPACELELVARWRSRAIAATANVAAGATAQVELRFDTVDQ